MWWNDVLENDIKDHADIEDDALKAETDSQLNSAMARLIRTASWTVQWHP